MKKLLLGLSLLFIVNLSFAQGGFEGLIVERFYISDANDTTDLGGIGTLNEGSVTYRFYVDMLPGYVFQAIYGNMDHELRLETTTLFFNNEDRGATTAEAISFNRLDENHVMVDSWVSAGAASGNGRVAVLKAEDDGMNTVVNADGYLQNNDPLAGIPLTQEDGLMSGPSYVTTVVGIDTELGNNFDATTSGSLFTTNNGSWASLSGAQGIDSLVNKVCVAQITTDGYLSYRFNVQIRNEVNGDVEQYVWNAPMGTEVQDSSLFNDSLSITTGIAPVNSTPDFSVYPNPTSDIATVKITESRLSTETVVTVYNVLGEIMEQRDLGTLNGVTYVNRFDFSSYPDGMYFVELVMDGHKSTKKLIVR